MLIQNNKLSKNLFTDTCKMNKRSQTVCFPIYSNNDVFKEMELKWEKETEI